MKIQEKKLTGIAILFTLILVTAAVVIIVSTKW